MGLFSKKQSSDMEAPRRRQSLDTQQRDVTPQHVFLRNRTLTGSTSDNVRHLDHPTDLHSPRTHVHHMALKRRKVGMTLFIVVIVSISLFWLLSQFTGRVSVSVSDTSLSQSVDAVIYENAINDYFAKNPLTRFHFALSDIELTNAVIQTLPEVQTITQTQFGGLSGTQFTVVVRKPVAGWTINNKQYFVDAKGIAFERNYYDNPAVQITDESGVIIQEGTAIASNRFLGFVGRVVALSSESNFKVTQAIIPANTTRQLEIKIDGVVPRVRLSIDRPAGEQVEDMVRALRYLSDQGRTPGYIDVRVSGKAFYL